MAIRAREGITPRAARGEQWFWRALALFALAACAVLLLRAGRARGSQRAERRDAQVVEAGHDEARVTRRAAPSSPRVSSLLAQLERGGVGMRCQAVDRLSRLPELDELAVSAMGRLTDATYPSELRRCAAYALGNVAHEAAFAPLRSLADDELSMLAETALVALATRPDARSRKTAIELSEKRPEAIQVAVACALGQAAAPEALGFIAALLGKVHGFMRERLVMALGGTGDARAVGLLQKYVSDSSRSLQYAAINALGEIGGRAATDTLLHLLRERPQLASAVAAALARSGGDEAREALLELADTGSGPSSMAALQALSELDGPEVQALMQDALASGMPQQASVAIEYFVNHPSEDVLAQLEGMAREGSMQIGSQVLGALGRMGGERAQAMLEEIAEGDGPLAAMALSYMGNFGSDTRATEIALAKLKKDPSAAGNLVHALARDDSPEAAAALMRLAASKDPASAQQALWAVSQRDDPESRALLRKIASGEGGSAQTRGAALWALAQSGDASALPTLRSALRDQDDGVRVQAVGALQQLAGSPEAEEALIAASRDGSAEVVGAASNGLAQLGSPAALKRLEQLARAPATAGQGLMSLVGASPKRAVSAVDALLASKDVSATRAALQVTTMLPSETSTRVYLSALRAGDPDLAREAMEHAANSGMLNDALREGVRALSTDDALPEDLRARARQLLEGEGGPSLGFMHERAVHGAY